uniref:DEAD/DEAH box helicase n=1 Tax=Kitasatospora sp. NBC_01519 TaxID=2903576 RepID=UPI002F9107E1
MWPHQVQAVDAACAILAEHDATSLVITCGGGKTRVGAEVAVRVIERLNKERVAAEALRSRRVRHAASGPGALRQGLTLVTVPTLALIRQTLDAWEEALGREGLGRVAAVCSEPNVLAPYRRRLGRWDAVLTSEPDRVAELLSEPHVTMLSTYQSLDVVASAYQRYTLRPIDVVVIDELHRTLGSSTRPWSLVHDRDRLPAVKRVGMTATPKMLLGNGDIISMDDPRVGPVAYRYPYSEARRRGMVAHLRLVVPVITDDDIAALIPDDEQARAAGSGETAQLLATQIALLKAVHKHGVRRMVTYHRTVAEAKAFALTIPQALEYLEPWERPASLWTGHINGTQPQAARDSVLGRLRSPGTGTGLVVVTNAKALTEGVNAPLIDAVAILDGRGELESTQIFGRACRLERQGEFKTATVFVPAITRPGQSAAQALLDSRFSAVFSAARALAATDDELSAHLNRSRRQLGAAGTIEARTERPDWLTVTGAGVPPGFAQAIAVQVVREASAPWLEYVGAAERYQTERGQLQDIPRDWMTPEGLPLGSWWHATRRSFIQDQLPEELREELESLGMVRDLNEHAWDTFIADLTAYRDKYGNVDVRSDHVNEAGRKLGAQVRRARNKFDRLTDAQHSQLKELGFTPSVLDATWDTFIADLTAYRAEFGNVDVKRDYVNGAGRKLGIQVGSRREIFDDLPADRQKQLTALGFIPNTRDAAWDTFIADLTAYRTEFGHVDVPTNFVNAAGRPLGLKAARHRGDRWDRLPKERQEQLTALGFARSQLDSRWLRHAAAWAAYAKESRTTVVPQDHVTPDGLPLSYWRQRQLGRLRAGKLPSHQVETLIRLGLIVPGDLPALSPEPAAPNPTDGPARDTAATPCPRL